MALIALVFLIYSPSCFPPLGLQTPKESYSAQITVRMGTYVAVTGSSSLLKSLRPLATDSVVGAYLKSSFGAEGKSSLLYAVGMFSFLTAGGPAFVMVGETERLRLAIKSWALAE